MGTLDTSELEDLHADQLFAYIISSRNGDYLAALGNATSDGSAG